MGLIGLGCVSGHEVRSVSLSRSDDYLMRVDVGLGSFHEMLH